jgi:predicted TIM-barrel fold metal-dependent hydrolase
MAEAGVKALRAWPGEHRFLLRREVFGPVLDMMVERRIPLLAHAPGGVSWENCYDLMADFPELVFVLLDTGVWGMDRYFRPLVEGYPNVRVDLTTYWQDAGIESFVERYGADRMLFGTGFPVWDHGGMMLTLKHAEITEEQKTAIAGGNLDRMLGEVAL